MSGSCLLYCRLRCCRTGGKGGGMTGSYWLHCTLRLCREGGKNGFSLALL